jgi:hypothetical protein
MTGGAAQRIFAMHPLFVFLRFHLNWQTVGLFENPYQQTAKPFPLRLRAFALKNFKGDHDERD